MWVFGYGSLMWRPGFVHTARVPGRVVGFKRRFWQGSPDHRGTPEQPGRVVTLLEEPGASTVGVAFQVHPDEVTRVFSELDHRESGGYAQHRVEVVPLANDVPPLRDAVVYVATRDNPSYLGPASPADIAKVAARRQGPSGNNWDYVFRLERALAELGAEDRHVTDIAEELRALGRRAPDPAPISPNAETQPATEPLVSESENP